MIERTAAAKKGRRRRKVSFLFLFFLFFCCENGEEIGGRGCRRRRSKKFSLSDEIDDRFAGLRRTTVASHHRQPDNNLFLPPSSPFQYHHYHHHPHLPPQPNYYCQRSNNQQSPSYVHISPANKYNKTNFRSSQFPTEGADARPRPLLAPCNPSIIIPPFSSPFPHRSESDGKRTKIAHYPSSSSFLLFPPHPPIIISPLFFPPSPLLPGLKPLLPLSPFSSPHQLIEETFLELISSRLDSRKKEINLIIGSPTNRGEDFSWRQNGQLDGKEEDGELNEDFPWFIKVHLCLFPK